MRPFRNAEELNREVDNQMNEMAIDIVNKVEALVNQKGVERTAQMLGVENEFIERIVNEDFDTDELTAAFVTKVLMLNGCGLFVMPLSGQRPPMMGGMGRPMENGYMPPMGNGYMPPMGGGMPPQPRRRGTTERPMGRMRRGYEPMEEDAMPALDREEAIEQIRRNGRFGRRNNEMLGDMPIPVEDRVHDDASVDDAPIQGETHAPQMQNIGNEILEAIAQNPELKNQLKTILNS